MSSTSSSTSPTSSSTAPTASSTATTAYKGKVVRSWAQLPDEIIRHIATHYLALVSPRAYCPTQWHAKEFWASRIVYTALRDTYEVEKLMAICVPWHDALEYHPFWQHGCSVLDPLDQLAYLGVAHSPTTAASTKAPSPRLSPFRHFRNIALSSCFVCRLNYPYLGHGLANARRSVHSPNLRSVPVCREHRRGTFCALCLRVAPHDDTNAMVCVAENEDEDTWPGVEATCRTCRSEWLYKRSAQDPLAREALGGYPFQWTKNEPDWETRQAVDTFVDMGEGQIVPVLKLAKEKHWLRRCTKLADMMSQAIAATRFVDRADGIYDGDGSDDDLSTDEEDPELMSITEDACGVRELAIQDWVRNRILDGHWISPADHYYQNFVPHDPFVPAEHPCPWAGAAYSGAIEEGESPEDLVHPRPRTYNAPCPPTFELCEHIFRVYQRTLRDILLPAMTNIVRRLLMESQVDGGDPAMRASRMSIEDVVKELRDQDTWSKGVDWTQRKHIRQKQEQEARRRSEDDDSSSSRSDTSHTTSPVLSTTTLQTTPSPPPSSDSKEEEPVASPIAVSSPGAPVPESPSQAHTLIRPVPYVPVTIEHLPSFSLDSLKSVWREACAPLYQCRCPICERALLAANTEAGKHSGSIWVDGESRQAPPPPSSTENTIEIKIEEHPVLARREEEEEAESDLDAEYDDEESEFEDGVDYYVPADRKGADESTDVRSVASGTPTYRKRSHDEASEEPETRSDATDTVPAREGTPPKRARLLEATLEKRPARVLESPPLRQRKRSSEELEDDDAQSKHGMQSPKRVRA